MNARCDMHFRPAAIARALLLCSLLLLSACGHHQADAPAQNATGNAQAQQQARASWNGFVPGVPIQIGHALKASDLSPTELKYGIAPKQAPGLIYQDNVVLLENGDKLIRSVSSDGMSWALDANDPRVAASALLYHVMNADGVRQDAEWERFKAILGETYGVSGADLEQLAQAGEKADNEAIDLYAFTSVLKRHLDADARKAFIGLMWEIVYADGELNEMEDNVVWRVAELIGVERRDRVEARQLAASHAPGARGVADDE